MAGDNAIVGSADDDDCSDGIGIGLGPLSQLTESSWNIHEVLATDVPDDFH